ncbi:heme ABC transporter ATP-binding protein [Pseudoalteromonas rubra]|uniref:Heme ABC transporter ATP-binding protein n=1 Tax=Pseudoalteromonas rubra TaxID=43658 RepID=A0A5S3WJ69_9GAMM|nr:heme ABC transporter ATP-binding protein [Pseudoalteromonas rubra]TMP27340.1 heme ABC transporter ATP-binding protein [Pseudoalteromonas rubra]TMP36878.1 heme ABC transporter ATP-binding protein [Pseudoalteromonas rubra]
MLECHNLTVFRAGKQVLNKVSLTLEAGQFIVLLGENGAGKSTLLSAICDDIPYSGQILWHGHALDTLDPLTLATQRAVLLQHNRVNFAFNTAELIAMGRYPYQESSAEQAVVVDKLITLLALEKLARREVTQLSGGEFQRAQFARCLAQLNAHDPDTQNKLMLLDEPTSALDLHHQHRVLSAAQRFARQGNTVVAVLHDLNLASLYADRILLLDQGQIRSDGPPQDVLRRDVLQPIYQTGMQINLHPGYNIPMIFSEPLTGAPHA